MSINMKTGFKKSKSFDKNFLNDFCIVHFMSYLIEVECNSYLILIDD